MRISVQKRKGEAGQATLLVLVALSVFMIGAVGFAIDGSHLYAQRQMAQAAADAAAQAGIMSIFDGTNSSGPHAFSTSNFYCDATDQRTPCYYAKTLNGFNSASGCAIPGTSDCIFVEFPTSVSGVSGAVNFLRVTIQRKVATTFMRFLGPSFEYVAASGTAAVLNEQAPIPIVVLHPTLSGSFSKNGSNDIVICGGPARSIQVNSRSTTSVAISGASGTVDLSHAGPRDPGDCSAGTGASFGNSGGPTSYPGTLLVGSLPGRYLQPTSILTDPLLGMSAPPQPTTNLTNFAGSGYTKICGGGGGAANCSGLGGAHGCPATLPNSAECRVYSPGHYANGISIGGSVFALFRPGIYYIDHNGFQLTSNSIVRMAVSPDDSDPTPSTDPAHTTWTQGMLIYNNAPTPVNASNDIVSISANSGQLPGGNTFPTTDCPNGGNCLVGANGGTVSSGSACAASPGSSYYGTLFFQNRATATSLTHSLQGGGGLSLKGTIYLTHTAASIASDGKYQSLSLQGTPGSTTKVQGEIIVDALSLGGNANITMNLNGLPCFTVKQVALVR